MRGFHKKHTEETKLKISLSKKGSTPWNKGMVGLVLSSKFFKDNPTLRGAAHHKWTGNNVSYRAVHKWIESKLGKPHQCTLCSNEKLKHRQYHWANISRLYKRLIEDWVRLCAKCHKAFDRGLISL